MKNVGIFLFNDIELLDFAGPYEVFSVTDELNAYELFKVFTISADGTAIKTVNGLQVVPDFSFAGHPPVDILVVPGGAGTKNELAKKEVLAWVGNTAATAPITMSVCSGARILGALGLLEGRESITHHEVIAEMAAIAPGTVITPDKRFVDAGRVMTAGGISAGIDLALHIVRKLYGGEVVDKTIRYMEYGNWRSL